MKTALFVLIGAGAFLGLAGCQSQHSIESSHARADPPNDLATGGRGLVADHTIDVHFDGKPPDNADPKSDRFAHWKLTENGNGALHLTNVFLGNSIRWRRPVNEGSFSIVVTNKAEWKPQGPWRNDVPPPFNGPTVGVIDSKETNSFMVVDLSVSAQAHSNTVWYIITVPPVPSKNPLTDHFRVESTNDLSMVDATMDWNSSRK
jgi:hypothetical protein